MNNWDKRLAQEAMKYGFVPSNPKLYAEETIDEAPALQTGNMTGAPIRGYSPVQFVQQFRVLLSKLGFSRNLPIKQVGMSFYIAFENMPKAEDFSKTIGTLLRKNVKQGANLTKVIPIEKEDKAVIAGYVPAGTKAAVILNMSNLTESFTMQNLYDLRLMLLALMTDENIDGSSR